MRLRKIITILLSLSIAAGLLSGCGGNEDKKKADKASTRVIGKYVEENVELPFQQNESVLRLLKNIQGGMEIYTRKDSGIYAQYSSLDGKEWKEEEASWLNQNSWKEVISLAAGKDGNYYAIVMDDNSKMHLLKKTEEGTGEEISIPELNEATDQSGSEFYSFGTELQVMENGNLILEGNKEVKIYSQEEGKMLYALPYDKASTDARSPVDANGESIVLPSKDNVGFTVWNKEKEAASMSYGFDVRYGRVVLEDDSSIYFLNKDGIHHMQPDGTLVEILADGSSMAMGLPKVYAVDFIKGTGEKDFYALYKINNGKMSVKHYFYNENTQMESDNVLHIYSLEENNTVRQAVSIFQQKYPEVEVSYMTGEAGASATKADKIRVLNTELLNKSGADVLILDGLPVDSLIEKGVLKDISNIMAPLIEDGTLAGSLAECYRQEDGKIYTMPAKYGIPILYGNQEVIDAMEDLDTLEHWLNTHKDRSVFSNVTYDELTRLFVNMYYDELFDEAGKLKPDKLEQFLSCVKKAGERAQAEMERDYTSLVEAGEMEGFYISDWMAGNGIGVIEEKQVASQELASLADMMIPFTVMRENALPLLVNKETFIPHGLAGINSASSATEMAEEFIKILFSGEVQEYDLGDGFPMNQSTNDSVIEQGMENQEEQENGSMIGVGGTDDGRNYSFVMPLKAEVTELLEKAEGLKKPAKADGVLLDMIFEEAKVYYGGNQEVEQTVQGITAKVDTYLAE